MAAARSDALDQSWNLRYGPGEPAPDWTRRAACLGADTGLFYDDRHTAQAAAICDGCPVRLDCLQDAWNQDADAALHLIFGVRGGLTADQRRAAQRAARASSDKTPVVVHGTWQGYERCRQLPEGSCVSCREAYRRYHSPNSGSPPGPDRQWPHKTMAARLVALDELHGACA